jgi:peptide/nickel transport system substrate-binding protein
MEIDRRTFISGGALLAATLTHAPSAVAQTPLAQPPIAERVAIDLVGPPDWLDPALARSTRDWSVVHAIFDSIAHLGDDGTIKPLAAERIETIDDTTIEIVLRPNIVFHDGSPVTAEAIARGIAWVQESEGPAATNFAVIDAVTIVDDRTARLTTSEPAAWLMSQLAVWLVLFPESMTTETFTSSPIGTGPYMFVSSNPGADITLRRNPDYPADSPKGTPLAEEVVLRFVPDAVTRVSDLASDQAQIIQAVPLDLRSSVQDAGASIVDASVLGISFLRIATDIAPFDDPRVGQALNMAIDVDTIASALVSSQSRRLASIFPDSRAIGFDPELAPFTFDPEAARSLLQESGLGDGFDVDLEFVASERNDIVESIAAYLGDVGVNVNLVSTELATFNSTWKETGSAPLRFVSWRPVFDPHTLLSLMFASTGPLSRYADPDVDAAIATGAATLEPDARAETYRGLARRMREVPPAVLLWNLATSYGVAPGASPWTPRPDEYLIPTHRAGAKS